MPDLALYRLTSLSRSSTRIQALAEAASTANLVVSELHVYALTLVNDTLERAAHLLPSHPSQEQIEVLKEETRLYLNQIEGIGSIACQWVLAVVDDIAQLPE